MYKLKIIYASVREGRKGISIAEWVKSFSSEDSRFEVEFIDLKEEHLPIMDEPNHPRLKQYAHSHTKKWSEKIADADAFLFVTPEYNYGYPGVLRNALEYLHSEWQYKAAGIVAYGGISAGTRSADALKGDLISLKIPALPEMVNIPMFMQFIKDDGKFYPSEITITAMKLVLDELARWTKGMLIVRKNK